MIYDLNGLRGFKIITLNGQIGIAHDFYFSPEDWKVQYLMCDAGYKMTDRIIIFYKEAILRIEFENKKIFLNLTRDKIFKSPHINSDSVVTMRVRKSLHDYYGWTKYWEKENYLQELQKEKSGSEPITNHNKIESVDGLKCTREIINEVIMADSTELGLVKNLLMDVSNWKIVYMLIDQFKTKNEKKLVIKPNWIKSFEGTEQKIQLVKNVKKVSAGPKVKSVKDIDEAVESKLKKEK